MDAYEDLARCIGFDWDAGNKGKNWGKHKVSDTEAEEVFFNDPLVARTDIVHSQSEPRYFVLGQTNKGRRLFIALTIRGKLIRVISARDMKRRELREYRA